MDNRCAIFLKADPLLKRDIYVIKTLLNIYNEVDIILDRKWQKDKYLLNFTERCEIINHDLKVVQMVYGEDAYGAMSKFYDKQQQTYNEQLDFHRQEMDLWYARMEAAEEGSKE
jgi:hypothetical protein